jgi:hypothetical protein
MSWEQKYLKYKKKYLELSGGAPNRCRKKVDEEVTLENIKKIIIDLGSSSINSFRYDNTGYNIEEDFFNDYDLTNYGIQDTINMEKNNIKINEKINEKIKELIKLLEDPSDIEKMGDINSSIHFSNEDQILSKNSCDKLLPIYQTIFDQQMQLQLPPEPTLLYKLIYNYNILKKNKGIDEKKLSDIAIILYEKLYQNNQQYYSNMYEDYFINEGLLRILKNYCDIYR